MKVLVKGLGPAGTSFIITYKNNVDAFEIRKTPRSICAGGLGLWAVKEIESYGKEFKDAIYHTTKTYVREFEVLGKEYSIRINSKDFGLDNFGVVVNRKEFDIYLYTKAEEYFKRVDKINSNYDYIVDATGFNGMPSLDSDDVEVLLQYYVEGESSECLTLTLWKDYVNTGYLWEFPEAKYNIVKVGLGASMKEIKSKRIDLEKVLDKYLEKRGIKGRIVYREGALLPLAKPKKEYIVNNNVFKVGTSATLVDPLTGAGIKYAIRSGVMLARSNFDSQLYLKLLKPTLKELSRNYWLKKLFLRVSQRYIDKLLKNLHKKVEDMDMSNVDLNKIVRKFLPAVFLSFL